MDNPQPTDICKNCGHTREEHKRVDFGEEELDRCSVCECVVDPYDEPYDSQKES